MLQAPSHLSRVCGHSHFKKSWLMKTQNDNQGSIVCEKSVLASSSSRSVPSSTSKSSEDKRSPQLCETGSSMRSLLSGVASSSRPTRPLAIGSVSIGTTYGGGAGGSMFGSGKHLSLVTCAESLSPPIRTDPNSRSFCQPPPEHSSLDLMIAKDTLIEDDRSSLKSPPRGVSDVSATSSRCGSPSAKLQTNDSADLAEDISCEREPLESEPTEPSQSRNKSFRVSAMRSLLRARSAGLDVQDSYSTQEIDGSSRRGSGSWLKSQFLRENSPQKELHCENVHASTPAQLKKDSDSGKELDIETFRSPGRNFTAEGLNRSQGGKAPCKSWMPSILNGDPDKSSALGLTGGEDVLDEVGKTQSVNNIANEAINGRSALRMCSICGTSKTPLWRSGPHGPKSLCNACGIRFKKSRRCPGSETSDLQVSPLSTSILNRFASRSLKRKQDSATESQSSGHQDDEDETALKRHFPQLQKRSRCPILSLKKDCNGQVEDATGSSGESCVTWNLHSPSSGSPSPRKFYPHSSLITEEGKKGMTLEKEHSTISRTYAKDEEEAAVLLMALSCGLVHA